MALEGLKVGTDGYIEGIFVGGAAPVCYTANIVTGWT